MLDRVGDLSGVRAGNLGDRVCLANGKQVLDLANVVLCVVFNRVSVFESGQVHSESFEYVLDDQKVSGRWRMFEERSANEVVVNRGNCLPRIDRAKLHERSVVLWLEHKRYAEVRLVEMSTVNGENKTAQTLGTCSSLSSFLR